MGEAATALRQTGMQLEAEQMDALDEVSRAMRLRSRSAALRLIVAIGLAEWKRQRAVIGSEEGAA